MVKDKFRLFRKKDTLILLVILVVALVFRLYKISTPLGDFFSWRQADTSAVSRNFVKKGFDLLHPRYDDLSNIQSGQDNPEGYRMVEFPLYSALQAFLYKNLPIIPLEIYGRLITIFFSLIIIVTIYYFLLKESGRLAAIVGSLTYSIFPFFVFFSRVILPETTALALTFSSLLFLYLFAEQKNKLKSVIFYSLSVISFAGGLLIKPTVIFYLSSSLLLLLKKYRWNFFKKISFYLYFVLILAPLVWWRSYIEAFPSGIPANSFNPTWLLIYVNTPQGLQNIFFKPAFFRWIFFQRLNNLILGGYLTFFFLIGLITKRKRVFLHSLLFSAFLYLFTFQGGNVQHEYYQTLILPPLAIFVALGVDFITKNSRLFLSTLLIYLFIAALFALSFFFSFYPVRDYYNYSSELVNIAKIVRDLTNEDDKIVTDTKGDTTLLYLMGRRGAPAPYNDVAELKKKDYKYYVSQNSDTIAQMKKDKLTVLFENEKFVVFKL